MISKELQKTLHEKYNPEGSDLRLLQHHLLLLLDHFDNICKKNGIKYWLSSGTCLGAIRHQGFIPWDDDIDVEMLKEDYRKFAKLFNEDNNFVLQTYKNELYYTEPFSKLRLKETYVNEGSFTALYINKGVFLDIFVMERSNLIVAYFCHFILGSLRHLSFHIAKPSALTDCLFKVLKRLSFGTIDMLRFLNVISKRGELRHTIGTGLVKNVRNADDIFPLGEAIFEGKKYPVPKNYDSYLKRMFGNYMEIPSSIHTHSLTDINFLPTKIFEELKLHFK